MAGDRPAIYDYNRRPGLVPADFTDVSILLTAPEVLSVTRILRVFFEFIQGRKSRDERFGHGILAGVFLELYMAVQI